MPDLNQPILLRYGGAAKSTLDMNSQELQQMAESVLRRAKEKAFYKGLPIVYKQGEKIIAEYSDGRKEQLNSVNEMRE